MNYSGIKYSDMINGPGIRVSLFVSGCSHGCKGCFNAATWDPKYGKFFGEKEEKEIMAYFAKYRSVLRGLSLLGGDPTFHSNIDVLNGFLDRFRAEFPEKDIWIWSGYTWEDICKNQKIASLIERCDVVVEGAFHLEEKDLSLRWRGSRNQRVIDISKSMQEGTVILHKG